MLSTILTLFLLLIFIGIAYWGTQKLLAAFGVGDPIASVVTVLVVIFLLLIFVTQSGILGGGGLHLGTLR